MKYATKAGNDVNIGNEKRNTCVKFRSKIQFFAVRKPTSINRTRRRSRMPKYIPPSVWLVTAGKHCFWIRAGILASLEMKNSHSGSYSTLENMAELSRDVFFGGGFRRFGGFPLYLLSVWRPVALFTAMQPGSWFTANQAKTICAMYYV